MVYNEKDYSHKTSVHAELYFIWLEGTEESSLRLSWSSYLVRKVKRNGHTWNARTDMQVLQYEATIFTQKKGTQHIKKTPIITPTVIAALWSDTW